MAKYPLGSYKTPGDAWVAVGTDANVCRHPYLDSRVSQHVPLYAYEFSDRNAAWYFPKLSFTHGAAHTIDIQFLFNDWHGGPLGILHRSRRRTCAVEAACGGVDRLHVRGQSAT